MDPGKHDFVVWAGATFSEMIEWQTAGEVTVDLNLYTCLMEVRDVVGGTLLIALSNDNGRVVPQVDGRALLLVSDEDTRELTPGSYKYDLLCELDPDGVVTPLLAGKFTVKALITQGEP